MRKPRDFAETHRKRRHLLAKAAIPTFVYASVFCVTTLALSTFLESTVLALPPEKPPAEAQPTIQTEEAPAPSAVVVEPLPSAAIEPNHEPDVQAIRKQVMEVLEREIDHHVEDVARRDAKIKALERELAECRSRP